MVQGQQICQENGTCRLIHQLHITITLLVIFYKTCCSLASKASLIYFGAPKLGCTMKNCNLKPSHNLLKLIAGSRSNSDMETGRHGCISHKRGSGAELPFPFMPLGLSNNEVASARNLPSTTDNKERVISKCTLYESVQVKLHISWPWKLCLQKRYQQNL